MIAAGTPVAVMALAPRSGWRGASRRSKAPAGPGPRAAARAPGPASGAGGNGRGRAPWRADGAASRTRRTPPGPRPEASPRQGARSGRVPGAARSSRAPRGRPRRPVRTGSSRPAGRRARGERPRRGADHRRGIRQPRRSPGRGVPGDSLLLRVGQRFGNHRDVREGAGARQEERRHVPAQPAGPHGAGVARQGPRVVEPERAEIRNQGAGVFLEDHRGNSGVSRPRREPRQSVPTRLRGWESEAVEELPRSRASGLPQEKRCGNDFRREFHWISAGAVYGVPRRRGRSGPSLTPRAASGSRGRCSTGCRERRPSTR